MEAKDLLQGTAPALLNSSDHTSLPNVIIVPPAEERQETPPWAYFDAQAHAQSVAARTTSNANKADELSMRKNCASGVPFPVKGGGQSLQMEEDLEEIIDPYIRNETFQRLASYEEEIASRGLRADPSGAGPSVFPSVEMEYLGGESFELIHPPSDMPADKLNKAFAKPRKNSFSNLFRRSNTKHLENAVNNRNSRSFLRLGKPAITPKRSFDLSSPTRASTADQAVGRRFSFFELRRRFSTSSLASNQSTTSLAASSTVVSPITPSDAPPSLPMPSILDAEDSPTTSPSLQVERSRMEIAPEVSPRVLQKSRATTNNGILPKVSTFLEPLQFESFDLVTEVLS